MKKYYPDEKQVTLNKLGFSASVSRTRKKIKEAHSYKKYRLEQNMRRSSNQFKFNNERLEKVDEYIADDEPDFLIKKITKIEKGMLKEFIDEKFLIDKNNGTLQAIRIITEDGTQKVITWYPRWMDISRCMLNRYAQTYGNLPFVNQEVKEIINDRGYKEVFIKSVDDIVNG